MKWLFLTVLVLVAGAVAAFAIYTWGWRETTDDREAERARAGLIARRIASEACETCEPGQLTHVAGTVWSVRVHGDGYQACWTFDTARFSTGTPRWSGVARGC